MPRLQTGRDSPAGEQLGASQAETGRDAKDFVSRRIGSVGGGLGFTWKEKRQQS